MKKGIIVLLLVLIIAFSLSVSASVVSLRLDEIPSSLTLQRGDELHLSPKFPLTLRKNKIGSKNFNYEYKLLNTFPMRKVSCTILDDNYVYLGGKPLGISVNNGGLLVTGVVDVITVNGNVSPARGKINVGDTIKAIDGVRIDQHINLSEIFSQEKTSYDITILRDDREQTVQISPVADAINGRKCIGLMLKEVVSGIGTLTYVNPKNSRFGALGHPIIDGESGSAMTNAGGEIFNATIFGAIKGVKGKAGELSGTFYSDDKSIGSVDKNNNFGVFGNFNGDLSQLTKITLGSKALVEPGKAYIYTTIGEGSPERYEIEIVKTSSQNFAKSKGMVIKVTDKRLLEKTGGIVQGMSGSPIVQNDRLVGAVTHVFISDPTRGYGMYVDWMIPN